MIQNKENNHERFQYAFRVTNMVIFEVEYGAITSNENWYLSTSAGEFIRSKKDWDSCGQCQHRVLPKGSAARRFYEKWDSKHLQTLSKAEYDELKQDIEILKSKYLYIYKDENYHNHFIPFSELKELSMQKVEKQKSVLAEIQSKGTSSQKTVGAKPLDKEVER